jgi:hypothetical protein
MRNNAVPRVFRRHRTRQVMELNWLQCAIQPRPAQIERRLFVPFSAGLVRRIEFSPYKWALVALITPVRSALANTRRCAAYRKYTHCKKTHSKSCLTGRFSAPENSKPFAYQPKK